MKNDRLSIPDVPTERSLTTPEELVELAGLYDVYGALLKDNQREIFEAYVLDNLSLSEIAEEQGVTRQGVYDTINRSRKKLREYESKLELRNRFEQIRDIIAGSDLSGSDRQKIEDLLQLG